jgi:hypothetical protein
VIRSAALALFIALVLGSTPAGAIEESTASVEGQLVQKTVVSIGILNTSTGKIQRFHLEPYFDEVYERDGTKQIELSRLTVGSTVRIFFNQRFNGPPRASRVELLHSARRTGGAGI